MGLGVGSGVLHTWAADIQVPYPEGEAGIVPAEEGYTWQEGGFLSHQHDS